jgi:hypothetical protein
MLRQHPVIGVDNAGENEESPLVRHDTEKLPRQITKSGARGNGLDGRTLLVAGEHWARQHAFQVIALIDHRRQRVQVGSNGIKSVTLMRQLEQSRGIAIRQAG